jgi:predicted RNase H-like HicB family nuclease
MKYSVVMNNSEYGFNVHWPALPGCHSRDTFDEAIENIKNAIKTYLQIIEEETKGSTVCQIEVPAENAFLRKIYIINPDSIQRSPMAVLLPI